MDFTTGATHLSCRCSCLLNNNNRSTVISIDDDFLVRSQLLVCFSVDFNTYTIQYLVQQVKARLGRKRRADSQDDGEGDSDLDLDRIVNFGICGESEDETAECH